MRHLRSTALATALVVLGGVPAGATATSTTSARSAAAHRSVPPVQIVLSSRTVVANEHTRIVARLDPVQVGITVVLRVRRARAEANLAEATTNADGLAVFDPELRSAGQARLRASTLDASGAVVATSPTVTLEVLAPFVLPPGQTLATGSSGASVLAFQQRMSELGYWLSTPDGGFGQVTEQAVYALQKAAGLAPTGTVDAQTVAALNRGVLPRAKTTSGLVIEVDLETDLLMVVDAGVVRYVFNTSTGNGTEFVDGGAETLAATPRGAWKIFSSYDGSDQSSLGLLWRPLFFDGPYAIHGDSFVPPYPASHGCVRISDAAINWFWASGIAPIGTTVYVY